MSRLFSKIAGIFGKSGPKDDPSQHTALESSLAT